MLAKIGLVSAQIPGSDDAGPIAHGSMVVLLLFGMVLLMTLVLQPNFTKRPIMLGLFGLLLFIATDVLFVSNNTGPGMRFLIYALPVLFLLYGTRIAVNRLRLIEVIRCPRRSYSLCRCLAQF